MRICGSKIQNKILYALKIYWNITLYAVINLQILYFGQAYSIIPQIKNKYISIIIFTNEITTMNVTIILYYKNV